VASHTKGGEESLVIENKPFEVRLPQERLSDSPRISGESKTSEEIIQSIRDSWRAQEPVLRTMDEARRYKPSKDKPIG
jgi:hypothetical protein